MSDILITGTGLYTPPYSVTNAELVESLARATERWNAAHAAEIERGDLEERDMPSEKFILKASGVGHRYVVEKSGILDPDRLRPRLPTRAENELSIQAEMAIPAAEEALAAASANDEAEGEAARERQLVDNAARAQSTLAQREASHHVAHAKVEESNFQQSVAMKQVESANTDADQVGSQAVASSTPTPLPPPPPHTRSL